MVYFDPVPGLINASSEPACQSADSKRLKLGFLMVLAQQPELLLLNELDHHLDHVFCQ